MAAVSSHLRNYAVAETIALLGALDSHPSIKKTPIIRRTGAQFQQVRGTADNHFAHVAPCSLLMNDQPIQSLFITPEARKLVERIFGMGVMAPPDWSLLGTFAQVPATQNRLDVTAEAYHAPTGLVSAFEVSCQAAASSGKWLGNAKHQHNATSLADYVEHHFLNDWKPKAKVAYDTAQAALTKSTASPGLIGHKASLLAQQIDVLQGSALNFGEIAKTIISSTNTETWGS